MSDDLVIRYPSKEWAILSAAWEKFYNDYNSQYGHNNYAGSLTPKALDAFLDKYHIKKKFFQDSGTVEFETESAKLLFLLEWK